MRWRDPRPPLPARSPPSIASRCSASPASPDTACGVTNRRPPNARAPTAPPRSSCADPVPARPSAFPPKDSMPLTRARRVRRPPGVDQGGRHVWAFDEPPPGPLLIFERLCLAHLPWCLLRVTAGLLCRTRGFGRVLARELDELVRGPRREPRPAAAALDGARAFRRGRILRGAPVDHHADARIAPVTTAQMLVESRLIPCDDDQIAHRGVSRRLAGAGPGGIRGDLLEQRAEEKDRHCRLLVASPAPRSGMGRTLSSKMWEIQGRSERRAARCPWPRVAPVLEHDGMREARRYDGERVRRVGQSGSTKEGGHGTSRTSGDRCRAHGTRLWGGEVAMEQPPDGPGPLRQVERDVEGARHGHRAHR